MPDSTRLNVQPPKLRTYVLPAFMPVWVAASGKTKLPSSSESSSAALKKPENFAVFRFADFASVVAAVSAVVVCDVTPTAAVAVARGGRRIFIWGAKLPGALR